MTSFYSEPGIELYHGSADRIPLDDDTVQTCVTSPPYFGLRDYKCDEQIGMEQTPDQYVQRLVGVFREVRRVLTDDGTLWVNIGDSYAASGCGGNPPESEFQLQASNNGSKGNRSRKAVSGYKPKDLLGVPWMLAFALRDDGWYLRGDHIWAKPNGMPESVEDRPTRAHEYVFLLSKSARYFYDSEAVRTAPKASTITQLQQDVDSQLGSIRANGGGKTNGTMKAVGRISDKQRGHSRRHAGFNDRWDQMERDEQMVDGANLRSVWWIPPAQCKAAHFAVMPERVAEICIRAGSRPGDLVLDPFNGACTTGFVARELGRRYVGIDLNADYLELSKDRLRQQSLFPPAAPAGRQP